MVFNIETTFHPTFLPWNCKSNDLVEINDNGLPSNKMDVERGNYGRRAYTSHPLNIKTRPLIKLLLIHLK